MRKSFRFLTAVTIACLLSIVAFSQNTVITGKVANSASQEVVPAVSVVVKGTSQGTYTNSNGDFSISVSKLPVTLVFTSIGYDSLVMEVTSAAPLNVSFKPNSQLGQEVVVSANRTPQRILESPVTVERMSSATIRNVAAPNYYEALANLKGVDMHTASLTFRTVTTRGFVSSGNVKMNQLVDGMDNQAPGLNFSVGSIVGPTDIDIDNVELLAGASSALYGSGGINGTLLINSKNPFKYDGLSFNIKQGINHIGNKQRSAAPYYDWAVRWAKNFNNKWAFKLSASMVSAQDWQAEDYRNKQQIGVLSKVVGGNRSNDPNFNGVNIYGDEASANLAFVAPGIRDGINARVLQQTTQAGSPVNLINAANAYFGALGNPQYPTTAQMNAFIGMFPAALQPTVGFFLPFYNGVKNNYFGQQMNVSRTGYNEEDLVDYNTINVKLNAALHYKITPNIEASWNTYFGTGTTVYTGADRYSLRNLKMAQHKLELKAKTWMIRGYTTQENAGDSYNATALGNFINEEWKKNSDPNNLPGSWFPQYAYTFSEARRQGGAAISDAGAHMTARNVADAGRLLPGTAAYDAAAAKVKSTPIAKGGAKFLDKSDLYAAEGQLNLSDALNFSDKLEIIVGTQWKQYVMNSQGTIFADTLGKLKISEVGGYAQLKKALFDNFLTLTVSGRYDKQTNFEGRFTPRATAVFRVAKDNNFRLSYQTAYRFPTNQDQYISLITGAGTLIGCLPEFQTYYKLNTIPGYVDTSVVRYRATGNVADLKRAEFKEVKPETVSSFEVGYKGLIGQRLLVDAYAYYSQYQDFIATIGVGQSKTGTETGLLNPLTTTNISYKQNSTQDVKAIGWGISAEYKFAKNYFIYGNVYSDRLRDLPANFVSFFNAPKYRFNIGLRNDNIGRGVGFNIIVKYQDNNYYEGTFVSGTLPYFTWVDAQVSYRPVKTKSIFRIGATNVGNQYYRTGFGSPAVGGLYYISYGYNLF